MKAPVSVCLIARDDPHLENAIASVSPWVEEVCVLSTWVTDNATRDIARRAGALYDADESCNDAEGRIENFAAARAASFAMATQPWVMWLDSDDIVAGADKLAELCREPEGTCFLLPYEYAYDSLGRVITRHYRERLVHGKDGMRWLYPVHEVLCAKDLSKSRFVRSDLVSINHQRQHLVKKVEPQRNLRILRAWMRDHPDDIRNTYYYGLELGNAGDQEGAIRELTKYVATSTFPDELAMAYYQLVRIYESRREYDKGLKAAFAALSVVDWFESYYAICRTFYMQRNWQRCVHYGNLALAAPPTETLLFVNSADRHDIHTLLTVAKNALGDVEGAYDHCKKGLEANPEELHLKRNLPLLACAVEGTPAAPMAEHRLSGGGLGQPADGGRNADRHPASMPPLNIVFATGPGCEKWDPETAERFGIGGSETMLIHMARELSTRGHKVTVYADPSNEGSFHRVEYKNVRAFRDVHCDVLVVSRYAQLIDEEYRTASALRLLWCHDVVAHGATHARLLRADRVLALSRWHKENLIAAHGLHPDHVIVTRNGIDMGRFGAKDLVRFPRLVNSSSPDRSWPVLLEEWPKIHAQVPGAELHLFYGFKNWRAMAAGDRMQRESIRLLERASRETPGVVFHDRVNQDGLALAFQQATVWAHPTWFTETSCISAMEAKAAGLHIVTSNLAALKETARGGVLIDGEWTGAEYRTRFVEECVKALRSGPHGPWPDVEGFALPALVDEWEAMFRRLLEEKKTNPLVPYQPTEPYRAKPHADVKLNIACGPNVFPHHGWVNYDKADFDGYFQHLQVAPFEGMPASQQELAKYVRENPPTDWAVQKHDMTVPFTQHTDSSVAFIYVGQAIEHLNRRTQVIPFLRECYRMLRVGGVLRMTTPDLRQLLDHFPAQMDAFAADQPAWFRDAMPGDKLSYLMFGAAGPDCTQDHYEGHFHLYDADTLHAALTEAGFHEFRWNSPAHPEIRDEGLSHSLLVEAVK